jgi:hypothetical protein
MKLKILLMDEASSARVMFDLEIPDVIRTPSGYPRREEIDRLRNKSKTRQWAVDLNWRWRNSGKGYRLADATSSALIACSSWIILVCLSTQVRSHSVSALAKEKVCTVSSVRECEDPAIAVAACVSDPVSM